ncbi:hypothetical protein ACFWNR_06190 [Streptomyces virginiae]|uniref:hypothetical protein n=1 Tax=Streptomyces virginiae TaxID=1961 RepID=UPI00364C6DD7
MNAFDWAAVFASVAFVVAVSWYANPPSSTDDESAWQESTGHDPQTVTDDVAEARKAREIAQLEAWLHTPSKPRNTIPHQTRRTEEGQ